MGLGDLGMKIPEVLLHWHYECSRSPRLYTLSSLKFLRVLREGVGVGNKDRLLLGSGVPPPPPPFLLLLFLGLGGKTKKGTLFIPGFLPGLD